MAKSEIQKPKAKSEIRKPKVKAKAKSANQKPKSKSKIRKTKAKAKAKSEIRKPTEKSEIRKVQRIIHAAIEELKILQVLVRKKIGRLIARGSSLVDFGRVRDILAEHEEARSQYYKASWKIRNSLSSPPTREQLQSRMENTEATVLKLRELNTRLDYCEEIFVKYKVPRLAEFSCLEAYELALRAFMSVWKEEAKNGRETQRRSLIEWIKNLDWMNDEEERATFVEMSLVMADLGYLISYHIGLYFTSIMDSSVEREKLESKFREMEFTLERLKVEENSLAIRRFLLVVNYVRSEIKKRQDRFLGAEEIVWESGSIESLLFHQIIREVLRFEIAFGSPDLPMMLINEVFIGMSGHLIHEFEKNIKRVSLKMNELETTLPQSVSDEDQDRFEFVTEVLYGVKEIWNQLDLIS